MNHILIIVDMQNDFITGLLGTKEAQAIVPKIKDLLTEYDKNTTEVFFTMDTHSYNYLLTLEGKMLPVKHCIFQSEGWQIVKELDNLDFPRQYVSKGTFAKRDWDNNFRKLIFKNGFNGHDVIEQNNVDITLCGVCTDICVISNALMLRALYPNLNIYVDASRCAGTTPEKHAAALEVMESCQIVITNK